MKTILYTLVLGWGIMIAATPSSAQNPPPPDTGELTQQQWLNQLDQRLAKATTDTARVKLLWKKGRAYADTYVDSAIYFMKQSAALAKKVKYVAGEREAELSLASEYGSKGDDEEAKARFHRVKDLLAVAPSTEAEVNYNYTFGTFYLKREQRDSAIIYFKKALPGAQRLESGELLFYALNNLALTYQRSADFQQALFYYQRMLKLEQIQYNPYIQAGTYMNMGLVYIAINDTVRAERAMFDAVRLVKNRGDNVELSAYITLTALYDFKQDHARLYQYAMKAAAMCRQQGDLRTLAVVWSRAALALSDQKKYAPAEALNRKAIALADSARLPNVSYEVYANMGSILTGQGKYSMALPFFERATRQLGDAKLFDRKIRRFYNNMALCYEKTGNYAKALTAFRTATMINDSARNRENIRKTVEQRLNFDFEKKQAIARLERQNAEAKARTRQGMLGIGLGAAILLTGFLFWAYRTKQRDNGLLKQQKAEIERTLTQLKTTQTQLIHKEKMASLGELTAGIAHEIQNPLNFVNNFSELSTELVEELEEEQQKPTPDASLEIELLNDLKDNLNKINHHGNRASSIVKGMLEHARRSSGDPTATELNKLVDEYLRLAYHGIRAKDNNFNAELVTDFDGSVGEVVVMPQEMGRVLLNLFSNAFYAVRQQQQTASTDYHPVVTVRTERQSDQVAVIVRDNGIGMPDSVKAKIFQPFFTTKPTGEGTGLGLSLSYDIITKGHGGNLTVISHPGQGAEFMITLPDQATTA